MIELNSLRIKTLLGALAFTLLVNARAELPPSVYEEMKRGAGEVVVVKVSKVSQGDSKSVGQRIQLTYEASVIRVIRSKSGLRPNAKITIQSSYYRFGRGEVGPSNPRRLKKDDVVMAYLQKWKKAGDYKIAAGGHSFENPSTENQSKILIGGKTPREVLNEFKFQGFLALNDQHWQSYNWVFSRLDTNKDGRHSKEEYIVNGVHMNEQARKGIFNAADYDQDGFVSAFEYFENRIITDEAKLIFEAMDQNKNGQLTRSEFMRSKRIKDLKLADAIFQALDTNNNGELIIPEYLRVWGKWARSK